MSSALLGVYGLTYHYGKRRVLEEVSFELESGEILALLGPNGSGKSTLLKVISGILPYSNLGSGQIRYRAANFLEFDFAERARTIAYVPSELRVEFPVTAYESVLLGRICHGSGLLRQFSERDHEAARWAMEQTFSTELAWRDLHTLSGGERQLVSLARALAQGAKILLLDEALSAMDLNHQTRIGKTLMKLADQGYSIVLVAHDVNLASAWAKSALLLKDGKRLAHGSIREVLTLDKLTELYPGADLTVSAHPVSGAPRVFL